MQDVSIVITCNEVQQPHLRQLLPQVLSLQYEGQYEVIVVDTFRDKDLLEWLEEMEVHYPHLSHTFCSTNCKGINLQRLAYLLGAKSSSYDWLVFLTPEAVFSSNHWLNYLVSNLDAQLDILVGTIDYKKTGGWKGVRKTVAQWWKHHAWPMLSRRKALYYVFPKLIAYRRSYFLECERRLVQTEKPRVKINKSAPIQLASYADL